MAWHSLGWEPAFFSEIEAFPRAVLTHHYPDVPVHGDFTTIGADEYGPIELLVGGTPCQSFSVAGLRGGMADDRGNLALEYLKLAQRKRPRWLVWENVPGVLSSNGGRDFGAFLGGLVELGYGFAYRILDAQYVRTHEFPRALAQRRRRVFVVGYLGDWRRAAAVLFERYGLQGHNPPRRQAGERIAPTVTVGPPFSRPGNERVECDALVPMDTVGALDTQCGFTNATHQTLNSGHYVVEQETAGALDLQCGEAHTHQSFQSGHYVLERPVMGTLTTRTFSALGARDVEEGALIPAIGFYGNANAVEASAAKEEISPTLKASGTPAVAFTPNQSDMAVMTETCPTLIARQAHAVTYPINTQNMRSPTDENAFARGIGVGDEDDPSFTLQAAHSHAVAIAIQAQALKDDEKPQGLGIDDTSGASYTLTASDRHAVAVAENTRSELRETDISPALTTGGGKPGQGYPCVRDSLSVRRLTPVECERLQGFPDGFTAVPYRNKDAENCPDGPRYKALGNSMAVPVMQWIGTRIAEVDALDVE